MHVLYLPVGRCRLVLLMISIIFWLADFSIHIATWWYGALFLVQSDSLVELLLNVVALTFILYVDDGVSQIYEETAGEKVSQCSANKLRRIVERPAKHLQRMQKVF